MRGDRIARRGTGFLVSYASAGRPPQARIGNAITKIRWDYSGTAPTKASLDNIDIESK